MGGYIELCSAIDVHRQQWGGTLDDTRLESDETTTSYNSFLDFYLANSGLYHSHGASTQVVPGKEERIPIASLYGQVVTSLVPRSFLWAFLPRSAL